MSTHIYSNILPFLYLNPLYVTDGATVMTSGAGLGSVFHRIRKARHS